MINVHKKKKQNQKLGQEHFLTYYQQLKYWFCERYVGQKLTNKIRISDISHIHFFRTDFRYGASLNPKIKISDLLIKLHHMLDKCMRFFFFFLHCMFEDLSLDTLCW